MENLDWHTAAKQYLETLGIAEAKVQKSKCKRKKFRYEPSQYHRDLIECLNRNDEEGFKALKLQSGYASTIGY